MKTLRIITITTAAFAIMLASCADNGPVSVDEISEDGVNSASLENTLNTEQEAPVYSIPINPSHIGAENPGFETGSCPAPPEGQEGWWGWHFVMPGTGDFTALSVTFQNAGSFYANPFPGDPAVFVADPDDKHAYIWTPTPDILTAATAEATVEPTGGQFVLSHVCEGDAKSLDVNKTVDTYYIRTHDWSIEKEVETEEGHVLDDVAKIWLYTDESGDENAEWTVEVTYEGYEDSGWKVSGEITIENIGTGAKLIDSVVDELAGNEIDIECKVEDNEINFPYSLAEGATITCTYSEGGYVEGDNVVTVTLDEGENDPFSPYSDTKEIVWGDPDDEINAIVDVVDISELFGTVDLGTLNAADFEEGDSESFDYDKDFAFKYYYKADECGAFKYDNTADVRVRVVDGDDIILDSADASLKVNVQCFVYESAWALDTNDPLDVLDVFSFCDNGFNNWGWSNYMETGSYILDLYAGAGQCDISKGTYVGYVEITYNGGFNYEYHIEAGLDFQEFHIYAGSDMFPKHKRGPRTVDTTAPGQYYLEDPLTGNIYVIAHGVVGLPDPDFGP